MTTEPMDARDAIDALRATGSSDPDVLFARKQELLGGATALRLAAAAQIVGGAAASLTVVGAIVGIPAILGAVRRLRSIAANVEVVDRAYAEYVRVGRLEQIERRKREVRNR